MKRDEYIKKRMESLKGIPKYARSPIQRKNIAIKEWDEKNIKETALNNDLKYDLDGDGDFDIDDVRIGAGAMSRGRKLKKQR